MKIAARRQASSSSSRSKVKDFARQALDHQRAGAPARRAAGIGHVRDRDLQRGLDLLALAEIMMDAFGQGAALQLDDALIALGMLALIDGQREIARAQEPRHRRRPALAAAASAARHRTAHSRGARRRW